MTKTMILLCALCTGCATAYQNGKFSLTGGYFDEPVNDKLVKVVFSANAYTDIDTAVAYARFRCAQLAQERNKPYFLLYSSLNSAAVGKPSARPSVGTIGAKPAAFAYVLLVDAEEPGAIETSTVIAELDAHKKAQAEAAAERRRAK